MKPANGELDLGAIVKAIIGLAQTYGVTKIYSDKYGGAWPQQWFQRESSGAVIITDPVLTRADGSTVYLHKADAFRETGPYFQTGCLRLLDNESLVAEFRNLESRPLQGGRIFIGRPKARGMLDDQATAVATAAAMALAKPASAVDVSAAILRPSPISLADERKANDPGAYDPRYAAVDDDRMNHRGMSAGRYSSWRSAWTKR
jgi:hypothetical protein